MIPPEYKNMVSGLLSRSKQYSTELLYKLTLFNIVCPNLT